MEVFIYVASVLIGFAAILVMRAAYKLHQENDRLLGLCFIHRFLSRWHRSKENIMGSGTGVGGCGPINPDPGLRNLIEKGGPGHVPLPQCLKGPIAVDPGVIVYEGGWNRPWCCWRAIWPWHKCKE